MYFCLLRGTQYDDLKIDDFWDFFNENYCVNNNNNNK